MVQRGPSQSFCLPQVRIPDLCDHLLNHSAKCCYCFHRGRLGYLPRVLWPDCLLFPLDPVILPPVWTCFLCRFAVPGLLGGICSRFRLWYGYGSGCVGALGYSHLGLSMELDLLPAFFPHICTSPFLDLTSVGHLVQFQPKWFRLAIPMPRSTLLRRLLRPIINLLLRTMPAPPVEVPGP